MRLYDQIMDPDLLVRRIYIVAAGLIRESEIPAQVPQQMDMFTDYDALEQEQQAHREAENRERRIQKTTLMLQAKYGKNAVLKGMNLEEGGTAILRNSQIGGHRSGE